MDKWRYSYLIEQKTLWEKKKLLITSNFFFSHNVFKSYLLFMRQNEYLWTRGLSLSSANALNLVKSKILSFGKGLERETSTIRAGNCQSIFNSYGPFFDLTLTLKIKGWQISNGSCM